METVKEFLFNNTEEIFVGLILAAILAFFKKLRTFFKKLPRRFKKIKKSFKYKITIKRIERLEMKVPTYFLFLKSAEKNPELANIFRMIDERLIERPYHIKEESSKTAELKEILDRTTESNISPELKKILDETIVSKTDIRITRSPKAPDLPKLPDLPKK